MLAKDKGQEGEGVGVGWCVACGRANAYSVWILEDGLVGWFVYVSVLQNQPVVPLSHRSVCLFLCYTIFV